MAYVQHLCFCALFALNSLDFVTMVTAMQMTKSHKGAGGTSNVPPSGKNIAVVIRGSAFRAEFGNFDDGTYKRRSCSDCAVDVQMNCTNSLIENVIEPLERLGNQIKVIVTDVISRRVDPCPLTSKIIDAFGFRVTQTAYFETNNQADSMRRTLDAFSNRYGGDEQIAEVFDYVLVARHDIRWLKPITDTQTDFSKFNFLGKCEKTAGLEMGGEDCVWDIVQFMPSRSYRAFSSAVGTGFYREADGQVLSAGCFDTMDRAGPGHPCKPIIEQAMQNMSDTTEFGFMTDIVDGVREVNDYISLYLPKCEM